MKRRVGLLGLFLAACSGGAAQQPPARPAPSATAPPQVTPAQQLTAAAEAATQTDYKSASLLFEQLLARGPLERGLRQDAALGLAEVYLHTGKYEEVIRVTTGELSKLSQGALLKASAERALGRLDAAQETLAPHREGEGSRRVRLALGEVLLELGQRASAEQVLMTLIEDYNNDAISSKDGSALAEVGRAAQLLRSPEDANDAFNEAEQVLERDPQLLLWRAELFLDNYDPAHAEEVLSELLADAPAHAPATVRMAQVKLVQALDFDAAKRLVGQALQVNPRYSRAFFVLAGLALRDMELEQAEAHLAQGLRVNPRDLELLSMRGAVRFLADDQAGFQRVREQVFALNPSFTKFYQIVSEYAEWEHRYEEIVEMMREAVSIDGEDAKALAQLGLNQIRSGDDRGGVSSLRRAFALDGFNVRAYNTLNLYEKTIPRHYVDVPGARFRWRYPKDERAVLERYVVPLMDRAWGKMVGYYGFTPATPVGIELYAERENFAIRTSGLPHTAIQGVCFGKTLASMSPRNENFNLGMTLWHELAHVFHIQMSKNRVPRWFTEGLAEYETLVQRAEWKRERDAELFSALRANRLPKIGAMNQAFTHAEDLSDVTVAYYASSQIVRMLAERYGRPQLNRMLTLWGAGQRTDEVAKTALGVSTEALDVQFKNYLKTTLSRYSSQFVPDTRVGDAEAVARRAEKQLDSADAQAKGALLALQQGDLKTVDKRLKRALKLAPKHGDALWLAGRLALRQNNAARAIAQVMKLIAAGHDGYDTQLMNAKAAEVAGDEKAAARALVRAHRFDPQQAEALYGLLKFAQAAKDRQAELSWLLKLAALEEHAGSVYRRLTQLLTELGRHQEAVRFGEAAVFADMEGPETHLAFAQALAAAGNRGAARFEFESALVSPAEPAQRARVHAEYAKFLRSLGLRREANQQRRALDKLLPTQPQPPAVP